jgi:hypothetical protein
MVMDRASVGVFEMARREMLSRWLQDVPGDRVMTMTEILTEAYGLEEASHTKAMQIRTGVDIARMGWAAKKARRGKSVVRVYVKSASPTRAPGVVETGGRYVVEVPITRAQAEALAESWAAGGPSPMEMILQACETNSATHTPVVSYGHQEQA